MRPSTDRVRARAETGTPWTAYVLMLLLAGCAVMGFRVWQHSHDRAADAAPVAPISSTRTYWVDPQYLATYQGQLATYVAAQPGKYAVATIDVTTGAGVGINQDLPFRAASVNKLELAISLYRRALSHQINLDATTEIADEEIHRMHFHIRDLTTGGIRAMDKYLDRLDDIRRVQTYIVGRARRESVPVVENANVERTIDTVIELVMQASERARPA